MTPNEIDARAAVFRGALEDGVISEVLNEMEQQFTDEWKRCRDALERDNLWRSVMILGMLRQRLGVIANSSGDLSAIRRAR